MRGAGQAPEPPWRSAPRRRAKAPRPQLSRDVVVAAALRVVEAEGGNALTMRRVASELGVSASSLYGYVANKEELVQLVLEQITSEVTMPEPGGDWQGGDWQGGDWQDLIKEWGRATFRVLRSHPGVAGLTLGRVPLGPSMITGAERMFGVLRAAGLPDQVAAFVGDLGSLYVGAYAYELDVSPMTGPEDFAAMAKAWLGALPAGEFPNTVALADKLFAGSADDRFEWGLDVLVRGLASYLTSPPSPDAHWPQPG